MGKKMKEQKGPLSQMQVNSVKSQWETMLVKNTVKKKTQNWAVYIVVAYMLVYLNRDES